MKRRKQEKAEATPCDLTPGVQVRVNDNGTSHGETGELVSVAADGWAYVRLVSNNVRGRVGPVAYTALVRSVEPI